MEDTEGSKAGEFGKLGHESFVVTKAQRGLTSSEEGIALRATTFLVMLLRILACQHLTLDGYVLNALEL